VPVLPVDTLLAVAEEARWQYTQASSNTPSAGQVLAMLDARMGEIYAGRYAYICSENGSCTWSIDDNCSLIRPDGPGLDSVRSLLAGGPAFLAGNVFEAHGAALDAAMGLPHQPALPTATALLRLAPQLLQAGQAVPADQALPLYIRDKVAQTTEERRLAKAAP
jgi:tRNA threonylcarbamoyladenosine biosynthesis protein TsaB